MCRLEVLRRENAAKTGRSGTTIACNICHGPELKGIDRIPPIAGRSPTYVVRQLYEFKHGGRAGNASALMKQTVEKLSQDDMIALAAYVARSSHKGRQLARVEPGSSHEAADPECRFPVAIGGKADNICLF